MKYAFYKSTDGYYALVEVIIRKNNGFTFVRCIKVFSYSNYGYGKPGDEGDVETELLRPVEHPVDLLKELL